MKRMLSTLQRILHPLRASKPCTTTTTTKVEWGLSIADMQWLGELFGSASSVDKARVLADRLPGSSAQQADTLTTWLTGKDHGQSCIARILLAHFLYDTPSAPDSQSLLERGTQFEEDEVVPAYNTVQQAALVRDFLTPPSIRRPKSEAFQSFYSRSPHEQATILVGMGSLAPEVVCAAFYYFVDEFKKCVEVPESEASEVRRQYTVSGSHWVRC